MVLKLYLLSKIARIWEFQNGVYNLLFKIAGDFNKGIEPFKENEKCRFIPIYQIITYMFKYRHLCKIQTSKEGRQHFEKFKMYNF